MNINIPPDSQQWLFALRGSDMACLWSFRWPPPCQLGDPLFFRFDGRIVARARVRQILPPGEHDTFCHNGRRYLTGHKVVWHQDDFEDLRNKPETVAAIERHLRTVRNVNRQMSRRNP
jgi:hypothetical protein